MKKTVKLVLAMFIIVSIAYIAILQWKISSAGKTPIPDDTGYLMILGTKVNGETPSPALNERIHTTARYLKAHPKTIAIASGGKGPNEGISEALAISNALQGLGIEENRIIQENQSSSTKENIAFSKKLIPISAKQSGAIVSNKFHLYRALSIAEDNGLQMTGLPAKTPNSAKLKLYIREYLAITKYYVLKWL
ncbi:YdcF family protein [Bacillus sp. 1P06AnD]|uniref:YdcF family protein n=1 Tax=Bacillus sp. 1P06AnD TaxID=3132208 RepID=UPI0039A3431F